MKNLSAIIIFVLTTLVGDAIAQTPTFEFVNLSTEQQKGIFSFEDENENFIITTTFDNGSKIYKLDSNGNFLNSKAILKNGYIFHINYVFDNPNGDEYVALAGSTNLVGDSAFVSKIQLDSNLEILDETTTFLNFSNADVPFFCNDQYSDTIICAGFYNVSPSVPFALKYIKSSQDLQLFPSIEAVDPTVDLIPFPANDKYLLHGFRFIVTDNNFEVISIMTNPPFQYLSQGDIHPFTDSTFLFVGKDVSDPDSRDIGVGILDFNFNEISHQVIGLNGDTIDFPAYLKAVDNNEDFVFVGGTANVEIGIPVSLQNNYSSFLLAKFDSEINKQWVKHYGGDAYYFMTYVHATQDGGCLMIGSKHDFENNPGIAQLYVLKVDEDGDIITSTTIPFVETKLTVFPNPTSDELMVELSAKQTQVNKNVGLYDLLGRKMLEKQMDGDKVVLDVSNLASTTYFLVVKDEDGKVIAKEEVVKID